MSIRSCRTVRRVLPTAVVALLIAAGLATAQPRLTLQPRDRVMLVGNTLAERQLLFNHFETSLLARLPALELTVRNLGWSGDTPSLQPRPLNFGDAATHLTAQKADVILAFFGLNESFAGEGGVAAFTRDLEAWVTAQRAAGTRAAARLSWSRHRARAASRLVPSTPMRAPATWPATRGHAVPCGAARVPFRDSFTPMRSAMGRRPIPDHPRHHRRSGLGRSRPP